MAKILVIEDEKDVLANLQDILEQESHQTLGAVNGEIGLELAKKHLPDLIICDILMPGINGYQVLTKIRENNQTTAIPFVFLTAKTLRDDLRKGMTLSADDYLTKPFKISELLTVVGTQLDKRRKIMKQVEDLMYSLTFSLPHELRTPLTSIIGYSQILKSPSFASEPNEIVKIGDAIYHNAFRLSHLIDNYLLYVDLNHSDEHVSQRMKHSDFYPIFAGDIASFCEKKFLSVDRFDDMVLSLKADPFSISVRVFYKILEELLDNSLKFSKPGTPVSISTEMDDVHFVLTVEDNGFGMKSKQIEQIGPFKQFNRDIYEQQGLGLGLFIVKKLIEEYSGNITIESVFDKGTKISTCFPLLLKKSDYSST